MADSIVVFLGPTLSAARATKILPATYLPPAEQGDVVAAVERFQPRVVVLIDGRFGSVPAVRHKELLWAASLGIEVWGAASMGALRAAELAGFGVEGFGLIYRWYRRYALLDDDEVAVAMAPHELGSGALGEALVDMRVTFRRARVMGVIAPAFHDTLLGLARTLPFVERSYERVLAGAGARQHDASEIDRFQHWLAGNRFSQKEEDAVGLLRHLRRLESRSGLGSDQPRPPFVVTDAFLRDIEEAGLDPQVLAGKRG